MPAAPAENRFRTGRPLLWAAGLVLSGLVVVLFLLLRGGGEVVVPDPAQPTPDAAPTDREAHAADLLAELATSLVDGRRREVLALAAPGEPSSRRELARIRENVREVGVSDLGFRLVEADPGRVRAEDRRELGDGAWVADVEVSWRIAGYDVETSRMEVALTLVDTPDGVAFGSAVGDYGSPVPLWLLEDLAVAQSRRALVAVADPDALDRYAVLADRAVREVRAVLPSWRGRLVVEVPSSQENLHRLLDAEPGTYASIAALTATVDGSGEPGAPVHILVNPDVFAGLGDDGSQIVMTHEATHVAVDAATSSMPLWLLEGFADYVALARADLPVSVTASQILAEVRRNGPPARLPGAKEFETSNKLLGTSYEAAWLACRLLAEEYGERRLIAFYRDVEAGTSVAEALESLGTTEAEFTRQWRGYLRELAG